MRWGWQSALHIAKYEMDWTAFHKGQSPNIAPIYLQQLAQLRVKNGWQAAAALAESQKWSEEQSVSRTGCLDAFKTFMFCFF